MEEEDVGSGKGEVDHWGRDWWMGLVISGGVRGRRITRRRVRTLGEELGLGDFCWDGTRRNLIKDAEYVGLGL